MRLLSLASIALVSAGAGTTAEDPRTAYDVQAYRLDLRVDPDDRRIEGTVGIEIVVLRDGLHAIVLDAANGLGIQRVLVDQGPLPRRRALAGQPVYAEHDGDRLTCQLPRAARRGQRLTLAIRYSASPGEINRWKGVRWSRTDAGEPRVDVSVQNVGAHHWWPCKASFFHPEDRAERLLVNLTVPEGLKGVSNGALLGRVEAAPGLVTWRWRHDYPIATYGVCLNVGPYEMVQQDLELPEVEGAVPFVYFVLPENLDRARYEFAQVPEILSVYTAAFGPWPFAGSKIGLVESTFLGPDHSTIAGYGSTYPDWRREHGIEDPQAAMNRGYDYILVHQLAHEWWGNSVAAGSWNDYWLQEGFATYAESLWLEHAQGRERADEFFLELSRKIPDTARLACAGKALSAREAFSSTLHFKGAWVLHMIRHYLDDDDGWWRALRRFQADHRHGVALTRDFREVLEEVSDSDWRGFFDEWVYGRGYPRLDGGVTVHADHLAVDVDNSTSEGRSFHVPLDIAWTEAGEAMHERLLLEPGANTRQIVCEAPPEGVRIENLQRLLGRHDVRVRK